MEFIPTNSFLSPLKGFLILSPATQRKKGGIMCPELDDKPRVYIVGTMQKVNQKISNFKAGLQKFDSRDLVIEDSSWKRSLGQKKAGHTSRQIRGKEKELKAIQNKRFSADIQRQSKTPHKKAATEKDKLVELYHYPGYIKEELTPLPNGIELIEIVEKVIHAQRRTPIGKTAWSLKMLRRFLNAPCTQAVLLDSFWWFFLHLYHPNPEIQGYLFDRIAENYSRILLGCHKVSNQENILKFFPSLLSQTVYTCFCSCFTRSWFNTEEFKAQLCDVFCEWLGGTLHAPGDYNRWDYSQLEPERSRREDMLSGKSKLGSDDEDAFGSSKTSGSSKKSSKSSHIQKRPESLWKTVRKSTQVLKKLAARSTNESSSSKESTYFHFQSALQDDLLSRKNSWRKQPSTIKKPLKIAYLPREQSELSFTLKITASAETYSDVIKQSFNNLYRSRKAYRKVFLRHRKEMKNFDQQCKENQELFRQEEQEEIKKKNAEKKKELLSLRPDALDVSHKGSALLPKICS